MSSDFASLALLPSLVTVVAELGYEAMTPIQAQAIPVLLAGKDLIGQSKTGSGKTAAFALPILHKLDLSRREVQALVLCPTRELCAQVTREFRKLGRNHPGLQVLPLSGGEPVHPQARALERGVHVAVGTPGRVIDHLRRGRIRLSDVSTAVLDEADRMLDMGFSADMEEILAALRTDRQTVFFSATFPPSIVAMGRAHQRGAVRVTIDDQDEVTGDIQQHALIVEAEDKQAVLYDVLRNYPHESALIFCNLKVTVRELARELRSFGLSVDCLHGDLEQFQRDQVMAMFRNKSVRIIVATDVAARGLDVAELDLVVNYDLPLQPEVYVHRIGRTGRAGNQGVSVSFAMPKQRQRLADIEHAAGAPLARVKRSELSPASSHAEDFARPPQMDTIQVSGGRKDKVRPGDILGALTGEAGGLDAVDVGKIEIHDRLTYVAVSRQVSQHAVRSLNEGRIKGRRFRASLVARPQS